MEWKAHALGFAAAAMILLPAAYDTGLRQGYIATSAPIANETTRHESLTAKLKMAVSINELAERKLEKCKTQNDHFSMDYIAGWPCDEALYYFNEASRYLKTAGCNDTGEFEAKVRFTTHAGLADIFVALYDIYLHLKIRKPMKNELFEVDSTDGLLEIATQQLRLAEGCAYDGSQERLSEIRKKIGSRHMEKGKRDGSVGENT